MAGCGQCPDQCTCVIAHPRCADEALQVYSGAGTPDDPVVIPYAHNWPLQPTSSDDSVLIEPGNIDEACADGHRPDLRVNWCLAIEQVDEEDGDLLIYQEESDDCRPKRLRDPVPGEFLGRHPDTGRAAWLQGAVISGGEVPFGVPLEFWGDESSLPANYALCYGQFIPIASALPLFSVIQHNANGGVDPLDGTFRLPDKRGYVTAGRDSMGGAAANRVTHANADILGGTLGVETITLAIANLPGHTHPLTIAGSGTGVTVNNGVTGIGIAGALTGVSIIGVGDHIHPGGSAGRSYVMVNNAGIGPIHFAAAGHVAPPNDNPRVVVGNADDAHGDGQLNNANTGGAGSHGHATSDPGHGHTVVEPNGGTGHGHGINDPGHGHAGSTANAAPDQTNTPIDNTQALQPTQFANYIIRLY